MTDQVSHSRETYFNVEQVMKTHRKSIHTAVLFL